MTRMSDSLCDQLEDFVGDRLSARAQAQFQLHLAACTDCRQVIRDHERLDRLLASATSELGPVPTGLIANIEQQLRGQSPRQMSRRIGAFAAAATVLVACGIWYAAGGRARPHAEASRNLEIQSNSGAAPSALNDSIRRIDPTPVRRSAAVRISFDRGSDAIVVPVESQDPNVSIFWLYPTVPAPECPAVPENDTSSRSET